MAGLAVPLPSPPGPLADDVYGRFVEHAIQHGVMSRGHHNQNFVVPLTEAMAAHVGQKPGTPVTVRVPLRDALPVVIRTWRDEGAILGALRDALPHAPRCLARREGSAVHSYVEGVPLSAVCQSGRPVDPLLVQALTGLLADMTRVRPERLPRLPACWPRGSRDSRGFLRTLARLAEQQVKQPNWAEFGGLFTMLGIPDDALSRFAARLPAMAPRPYRLLHTDLHRDNVIVSYQGAPPLVCVDWELATYGDPLHDLATHLVRMRYPDFQRDEVVEAWAAAMERTCPSAAHGLATDLPHYLAFERGQSVFPDVMRAAGSLGDSLCQKGLDEATLAVHNALTAAAEPLRLPDVPVHEIERILFRWQAARTGRRTGVPTPPQAQASAPAVASTPASASAPTAASGVSWEPDPRVPEHPECGHDAVLEALAAEGAAPAHQVFKGTGHLNTVVRVAGIGFPVVVRREISAPDRRERRFLSEHAVLAAIAQSPARSLVRTPKVLALGTSSLKDRFALHSYAGPSDPSLPPEHPVHGLRPHEADDLVDQLCALTTLDVGLLKQLDRTLEQLNPASPQFDFPSWLVDELVCLVQQLPTESQQLARELGLPDARRLREILSRHRLTPRQAVLLHGDLNPWNLVRGDGGLVVIDWEMATVGDPLYDLVRHTHLTPTRPEIRERMFARWSRNLPERYTRAWREDWRVYRRMEIVRSAYVDLDRLVTGSGLDAPNVRRAVDSYAMTLADATAALGLPVRPTTNPYLARALPRDATVRPAQRTP
ncbi:phosphotransferase [Streptomyces sp. O3]